MTEFYKHAIDKIIEKQEKQEEIKVKKERI
jgi:hypothetical protein